MYTVPHEIKQKTAYIWEGYEHELSNLKSLRLSGVLRWPFWCPIPLQYVVNRYLRSESILLTHEGEAECFEIDFIKEVFANTLSEQALVVYTWSNQQLIFRGKGSFPFSHVLSIDELVWLVNCPFFLFETLLLNGEKAAGAFVWANDLGSGKGELRFLLANENLMESVVFPFVYQDNMITLSSTYSLLLSPEDTDRLFSSTIGLLQYICSRKCTLKPKLSREGVIYIEVEQDKGVL